ncbi:MAG: hypothetical protein MZV63_72450 [Marinilabiliales bacterium]|nr:hypothetical protein [Marinilabiliales bacterium]
MVNFPIPFLASSSDAEADAAGSALAGVDAADSDFSSAAATGEEQGCQAGNDEELSSCTMV